MNMTDLEIKKMWYDAGFFYIDRSSDNCINIATDAVFDRVGNQFITIYSDGSFEGCERTYDEDAPLSFTADMTEALFNTIEYLKQCKIQGGKSLCGSRAEMIFLMQVVSQITTGYYMTLKLLTYMMKQGG